MKEEKKVQFTQKWIEGAVKKLLPKEDIYESDMEKITYLRIGEDFEKTILCELYIEEFDSYDAYEEWYQQAGRASEQDIGLFVGLEILQIQGVEYQDMTFLRTMPLLRVWKVVETRFVSLTGMDDLVRLKQLCC